MHFKYQAAGSCPSHVSLFIFSSVRCAELIWFHGSNLGEEHIEQDEEDQYKKEEATLSCFTLHCCCIRTASLGFTCLIFAAMLPQFPFGVVTLPGGF